MSARLSLLGTGGWIPTARRETTCAILSMPEALFIFDAGTGLSRLLEERFRPELEPEREVHMFLSHYHLDHVAGLVYLPAMFRERTVFVHPPAAHITGDDPEAVIGGLIRKPYNPQAIAGLPLELCIAPICEGTHTIGGQTLSVRKQIHADPSVAYRVNDWFVFATDTADDEGTATFARGARLLVHEAWIDGVEEEDPATERIAREAYAAHTSARQAAARAAEARVEELVLCHLNPLRSDSYHQGMLASAQKIFAGTRLLEDGETVGF